MSAVIASGNSFDGLDLIGPFDTTASANEYADQFLDGQEWHVIQLLAPLSAPKET